MKYSEFEKRITERLGFEVESEKSYIDVIKSNYLVGRVSKEYRYNLTIRTAGSSLTNDEARYLAHQCHELACTPLEEREDEKKYKIRHKYLGRMGRYLNYNEVDNSFYFASDIDSIAVRTIFTKDELVELLPHNLYGSICNSDIYEWEEVEWPLTYTKITL